MRATRKNFWKPFLFGCVGLFVATIVFASEPYREPEPPGTPFITNYGKNYCEMEFTAPVSDGGAPITHYIVEGRDLTGNRTWVEKGQFRPTADERIKIQCTVVNLTEGHTYEFCARAVNLAGPSRPSGVSKPIKIEER